MNERDRDRLISSIDLVEWLITVGYQIICFIDFLLHALDLLIWYAHLLRNGMQSALVLSALS